MNPHDTAYHKKQLIKQGDPSIGRTIYQLHTKHNYLNINLINLLYQDETRKLLPCMKVFVQWRILDQTALRWKD